MLNPFYYNILKIRHVHHEWAFWLILKEYAWIINKTINCFSDMQYKVKRDPHPSGSSEMAPPDKGTSHIVLFSEWNRSKFLSEICFSLGLYKCNGVKYFCFSINENFICSLPAYFSCGSINRILFHGKVGRSWSGMIVRFTILCVSMFI